MADHHEHPSTVTTWRDGVLVAAPEAEHADTTVWFALDPEGSSWEGIPAAAGPDGTATLCGVPYFARDLALGDVVSTTASAEGPLVAVAPLRRSGLLTFRVALETADAGDADDDRWQELLRELEPWSCSYDVRSPRFVALAAPPEHAQAVADHLHAREQRGGLHYETGRT